MSGFKAEINHLVMPGAKVLELDGVVVPDQLVVMCNDGATHTVTGVMGLEEEA